MDIEKQKEPIANLVSDLIMNANFVAEIALIFPNASYQALMKTLIEHQEILLERNISWSVKQIMDDGFIFRIDRTNRELRTVIR